VSGFRAGHIFLFCLVALSLILCSCTDREKSPQQEVVLYTSVDEPVARPIIKEFERQTGIKVILRTDAEATKTAGLAERLEAEKHKPLADVWWSNEIFHTINLAQQRVLAPYESPPAARIPAQFKDPAHLWAGTSLRVRVLAVSANGPPITSILNLSDPSLRAKVCMARPVAGTTKGHMASLYTIMGRETFEQYLKGLRDNQIKLLGGNSVVAEMVGRGQLLAGLTDNDDIAAASREGGKLEMILPDQKPDQMGALAIPCTVGLVAGAPHEANAKKLVDYLLSQTVEFQLIDARFARYSVYNPPPGVKFMQIDYPAAANNMKQAVELALTILEGR
jgi:iron(III) transport system substrate-binding protein